MKRFATLCIALVFSTPTQLPAATPSFADFDKRARAGETLNVVFFGSSLTWGTNASDPQVTSYRALLSARLRKHYPKARFHMYDAAMGGTGSQVAVFRLERDVLGHKPDLVIVDFSAHDRLETTTGETLASYEAILRRLITEGKAAVLMAVFPFQRHTTEKLDTFKRRTAHLALAKAYNIPVADAVSFVRQKMAQQKLTASILWPFDSVHPGDAGYRLFADAVWEGFAQAIKTKQVCKAPTNMRHGVTYLKTTRSPLSKLTKLPAGWRLGKPQRNAVSFDMLMSRWLDGLTIAANQITITNAKGKKQIIKQDVARLRIQFRGSTVLLLGESTQQSCKYRVYLDGRLVERPDSSGKNKIKEYDASLLAYLLHGNTHLVHVVAEGLNPKTTHTLEIEPVFSAKMIQQELRLESICVAGGEARVLNTQRK